MKKGDVQIVKCFSKMYGNKGRAFYYQQSESYVKIPVSAWCYIPTSLPQEQAAKTNMASMVKIQVFRIIHSWGWYGYYWYITEYPPTKLEKPGKALQLLYRKE